MNNFLNERTNWTKEMLQKEADKYKTRGEFQKKSAGAYLKARRLGLMDELFKNHTNNGYDENFKPKNYWTKEKLQEEADKYKTRGEFWENSPAASLANSKGLINKLFKNHPNQGYSDKKVIAGYWTEEILQKEVDKYQTRKDFRNNNLGAYKSSLRQGLIDKLFKNHPNQGYSDKEEWKENSYVIYVYELEEFNSAYVGLTNNIIRRDREHLFDFKTKLNKFCKENNIPYPKYKILEENLNSDEARQQEEYWKDFYKNNGWEMFNIAKTGSLGGGDIKWTKNKIEIEANKYKTRSELRNKCPGAYNAALKKGIIDDIFKDHENKGYTDKQVVFKYWTDERLQDEANKYKTRREFSMKSAGAYQASRIKGILDEIFKNHINQGYSDSQVKSGFWTKEKLQDEANKYKTLNDFANNSKAAYSAARKKGILRELFNKHPNEGRTATWSNKWTKEKLQEEADKYKTRSEFWKANPSAANRALKKGLMDELFKNHLNNGHSSERVKKGYYTKEILQKEADKYQTRDDFQKNNKGAYIFAIRNNLLDELFNNHLNKGYKKNKWINSFENFKYN